ncbi:MAG: hypothetical protein MUE48_02105 [Desulfobacterales bacterium]|jgi:hypothetical protein|nr:hypothetical protein [Desulfobacterales bacterium]
MTSRDTGKYASERRLRPRAPVLSEHMVELTVPGVPIYQLKLKDISETGAGAIVNPRSKLLSMVQVGLELRVRLITPRGSRFRQGAYRGRIIQITEIAEGAYRGHVLLGLSLNPEGPGPKSPAPVTSPTKARPA